MHIVKKLIAISALTIITGPAFAQSAEGTSQPVELSPSASQDVTVEQAAPKAAKVHAHTKAATHQAHKATAKAHRQTAHAHKKHHTAS
jgi:hypothetical protein